MGNHRLESAGSHADDASQHATEATASRSTGPRALTLRDWPVSTRLSAVIILALVMGLVFGGRQVLSATRSADEFGRVSQLAVLGQQVTGLVQALEVERDQTAGLAPLVNQTSGLTLSYSATDAAAAKVLSLAAGIGGSYPANIQARVATVVADIKDLDGLRTTAKASQDAPGVIGVYAPAVTDMIALDDQIGQGTSDSILVNDVQTLDALSLAKDEAAQERALLYNVFLHHDAFGDNEQQALITAQSGELIDLTAFRTTDTPAEQGAFDSTVSGTGSNEQAENIVIYVQGAGNVASGLAALNISPAKAPATWYSAQSGTVDGMQQVELDVAQNIVARAKSLQVGAQHSALITAILTAVILLLVLILTVVVARSLVGPLRRLREGALNIATVELPDRVRLLGEAADPSVGLDVSPIDVLSADEIGQVARAFDRVHSEAVRLAGNEAMLRNSFNAMFVNLSRRSQLLIERMVRVVDSLEQNEGDPERLSSLFTMDHLVTRMRRNSENLLLLAGHESARKRSEPVSLADVARAATSEIEQYSRVTLKIQPGIAVTGQAVSDVVHLLAEVIENATMFSADDTPVHVAAQELPTGGVLIEVTDSGVGIPEARLAEMNWRLDNPPVIDVSVARHMGLFAVARLAERHGVRVRLRPRSPHGLTALVWLPDNITEPEAVLYGARQRAFAAQASVRAGFQARGMEGMPTGSVLEGRAANYRRDVILPGQAGVSPDETVRVTASAATSGWFRSRLSSAKDPIGTLPAVRHDPLGSSSVAPGTGGWVSGTGGWVSGTGGWVSGTDGWAAAGKHAAQIIAEPVRGEVTAAGLPTRVPRANFIPGSVGGRPVGSAASRPVGAGTMGAPVGPGFGHDATGGPIGPGFGSDAQARATPRSPWSPEVARDQLGGFQRGARRATGQTDPSQREPNR